MKSLFTLLFLYLFLGSESFENYTEPVPNTDLKFEMVAIKGGHFHMGSADKFHKENENLHEVNVSDFWIAPYETTWDLYLVFQNKELELQKELGVDAIARPTKPYVEMSFGQGKNGGFPVCNVTQYAARAYCQWLYQKTGHFYRLPTEAEWEYAAKAGENTAWDFGDSVDELKDHAWFYANSNGAYKKTGTKKPNKWGLYDMYGNVAEWTSDAYDEQLQKADNPYFTPKTLYPQVIKGGHWDSDAEDTRAAAREPSNEKLKKRDPQIPRSDWWLTDAPFLGFRVVRPLKTPSKEEIEAYYAKPPKDI